jgi:signal transduction histidine kinase/ActR/RegA family two-component response regulator
MEWSVENKTRFGVVITLTILVVNAVLSYQATRALIGNQERVYHRHEVLSELEDILSTMKDAETGARGYIIAGEESYLDPYEAAVDRINSGISRLKQLTADDPIQQANIPAVEREIDGRLEKLKTEIGLRRSGDFDGARTVVLSGIGRQLMDELRQSITVMENEETKLLALRAEESRRSAGVAMLTSPLELFIACGLLLLTWRVVIRAQQDRIIHEQVARERAEAANRAKDEFVAMISHELRTPLSAMLGWAQLLHNGNLNPAAAARAVDAIERNARTQSQLIEDLLDMSRVIAGKLTLNVRPIKFTDVIDAALESVRPGAGAKELRLDVCLDRKDDVVSGDAARLQQIVWNLLSNAIKFTPKQGRIEVRLARIDSNLQLTVSDSGAGIPHEFLPYVFDRFAQAENTGRSKYGGLGLGLAIVRHLTELHGGTVRADSPGDGLGATFTLTLPLSPIREDATTKRVHIAGTRVVSKAGEALNGLRILIVDDEVETLELLTATLSQRGADVKPCLSASAALEAITQWRPSILVSDIGMPDEDGYQLIAKVRASEQKRGGQIPAVALTAYARTQDRVRALAAGFQMHVPKPVETEELVMAVASLAGRPIRRQQAL